MKNLTVRRRSSRLLESLKDTLLSNTQDSKILHAVNPNNDDFYLLLKEKLYKIPSNHEEDITTFNLNTNFNFVDLEYFSITHELYGACESGDIVRMNIENEFECEIVAQLNVKIQCMKFSPDHEMLVVVTVDGIVITMVSTLQVIAEVDLHSSDFGQKQFVTVGWGKKETQFHGSEGKKAALVKSLEINKNELDDGISRITWREDGSLFAVGFLHRESKARRFKVFDREGILQYTSEVVNGLEETLSWKPSGNLIATTQNLVNKHVVALFEKNGLKHREFSLPFEPKEIVVKDLFWSPDSEILTIWCKTHKDPTSILQLWTENNYHWYLKQTINFTEDNSLIYATWSIESRSKKLILLTTKELVACTYDWCINQSRGKTAQDKAVIGVIDGKKSLITGLRIGIVPPPMAHETFETDESINAMVFGPDIQNKDSWINSNTFFCVSTSNKLIFYKNLVESSTLEYEYVGTYNIEWSVSTTDFKHSLYSLHHFLWIDENTILCSASKTNQSILCVLLLDGISAQNQGRIIVQQTQIMDGLIEHLIPSPDLEEAYIVVQNSVLKYTKETELCPTNVELQDYSYKVEVVRIGEKHVVLSLSQRNSFSIDGKQIANNITSFYVHSEFLLLTTLQYTLKCVLLKEKDFEEFVKQDLTIKPWEQNFNEKMFVGLNTRRVERGSYLIAAISKDAETVLQMPRGNLECIQPRPLSLYIIGCYLDNTEYLPAFDLMRRQRISLSLIYDYDPQKFVENAEKFVEEISKPSWLSLFLSELQDDDVAATIYGNYYSKDCTKSVSTTMNKVEFVCKLLREIMEKRNDADHLIRPILISLVKSKKNQCLEAALSKVQEIKKLEDSAKGVQCITPDDALKYLLYLVDVNTLFDTALGMYDFDLTMFIASKSQKDPKEYVPFLNDLKKLDENYMKYSIDLHLKRYESALQHIAKDQNRFNECIQLVRNHNLYMKALKLFEKGTVEYQEIARAYGEFLVKQKMYQEGGVMFYKSGDLSEALNAYKLAGSWQEVVIISTQMNVSETEKREIYKDIAERLKSDRRYQEAANILINYLKDVEEAVVFLCDGKHWKDAVRVAYDAQRIDLIEKHVKPGIYEYTEHIMSQIEKNKQDFEKYKLRLAEVRTNISKRSVQFQEGMICESESMANTGISDILSDTTSITGSTLSQKSRSSVTSGRSYRSSKNRRKQERKLLSLKEGSAFEDLGLIQALHQLISNAYKEKDELKGLIQMLVYFDDDKSAEKVQASMDEFLRLIERSKSEIWDKSAPSSLTEMENASTSGLTEFQGLSISQKLTESYVINPPESSSSPWKLNIF